MIRKRVASACGTELFYLDLSEACVNPTMLLCTLLLLHPVPIVVLSWHTGVALLFALEATCESHTRAVAVHVLYIVPAPHSSSAMLPVIVVHGQFCCCFQTAICLCKKTTQKCCTSMLDASCFKVAYHSYHFWHCYKETLCDIQAGQQQDLKLDNAAGHGITWLPQELQEHMDGPGLDPTARIFDELEHLEPQATHCTQPASIVCAV